MCWGDSINDSNPADIEQAYLKLKELMPNIKVFNSDALITILIDEDALWAWLGTVTFTKPKRNPNLQFIFPEDGFCNLGRRFCHS